MYKVSIKEVTKMACVYYDMMTEKIVSPQIR